MINIEKAKMEFDKYAKKYDFEEENISRKYYHTYRVMDLCKQIAQKLNLNEEEINLSAIIGLLHDIARFEQYTRYKTYSDLDSIDHGDFGVEILEDENFIRKFVEETKYDNIIKKAIKNHNKYKIEDGLTEEELLYSKIIRDADKLDIFYVILEIFSKNTKRKQEIENGEISDRVMEQIKQEKLVLKQPNETPMNDYLVGLSFIFDFYFGYSYEVIEKENYINKLIDQYNFTNEDTKIKIEQIRTILNKYIQKNKGR